MTAKEFATVCSLQQSGTAVSLAYQQFYLTGKFVGCGEDFLVLDINGLRTVWPRELCEFLPRTYDGPTYS